VPGPGQRGYGVPALALAVFGAGLGLSLPLSADVVLATLPARAAGAGNALNRALQRIVVCLAPAMLGSVVNGAYRARLAGLPTAATASVAAAHAVARHLPAAAGRPLVSAANHAYLHGMVEVAAISAAVLAVGALLVLLFLPVRDPARDLRSGGSGHRVHDQVGRQADHSLLLGPDTLTCRDSSAPERSGFSGASAP
jgi:MFS transporter, DHA2 family, multidrug resistance protein